MLDNPDTISEKLAALSLVDLVGPADTRTPQIQLWPHR